jgi:hypothetical protein
MLRTRAKRWRATVQEGEWADLPKDLLAKVLKMLWSLPCGPTERKYSQGFFKGRCLTLRLVCSGWKAMHDAMVTELLLQGKTTDEAMGMLVRRFPAAVSLRLLGGGDANALTDKGMRAVSSLTSLTSLNLTGCDKITDKGMRAVSSLPALKSLDLRCCRKVTDEGVRAVSNIRTLTFLDLDGCSVTEVGLRAVSSMPALASLRLHECEKVTDEGVKAVSSMPALTDLCLVRCEKVTDEGVRALSNLHALKRLGLSFCPKVTRAAIQALRSSINTTRPDCAVSTSERSAFHILTYGYTAPCLHPASGAADPFTAPRALYMRAHIYACSWWGVEVVCVRPHQKGFSVGVGCASCAHTMLHSSHHPLCRTHGLPPPSSRPHTQYTRCIVRVLV